MEIELSDKEIKRKQNKQNTTCGMCFDNMKLLSTEIEGDSACLVYRVDPFQIREGLFVNRLSISISKEDILDIAGSIIFENSKAS